MSNINSFFMANGMLITLSISTSFGQTIIRGQVIIEDPITNPLEIANVALYQHLQSDSILIKGTSPNDQVSYHLDNISAGQYHIEISYTGFPTVHTPSFEIHASELEKDLGVHMLEEGDGPATYLSSYLRPKPAKKIRSQDYKPVQMPT